MLHFVHSSRLQSWVQLPSIGRQIRPYDSPSYNESSSFQDSESQSNNSASNSTWTEWPSLPTVNISTNLSNAIKPWNITKLNLLTSNDTIVNDKDINQKSNASWIKWSSLSNMTGNLRSIFPANATKWNIFESSDNEQNDDEDNGQNTSATWIKWPKFLNISGNLSSLLPWHRTSLNASEDSDASMKSNDSRDSASILSRFRKPTEVNLTLGAIEMHVPGGNSSCSAGWGQCGGQGWIGPTCCVNQAWTCTYSNEHYSQCLPVCPQHEPCYNANGKNEKCKKTNVANGVHPGICKRPWKCLNEDWCSQDETCMCAADRPCQVDTLTKGSYCTITNDKDTCDDFAKRCIFESDHDRIHLWQQCGGQEYPGSVQCMKGTKCKFINDYYSQCVPSIWT